MADLLTPGDYMAGAKEPGGLRIAYAEQPDQFGELHLPTDTAPDGGYPILVLLHGGCWRQRFGADPLNRMAAALTRHKLAVWNLEYRRLDGAGGWPMTFQDAATGLDHLLQIAPEHGLNLNRVGCAGHSAGGHLALWLAGRERLSANPASAGAPAVAINAVVSLAGIGNLVDAVSREICSGAPAELLGGPPDSFPDRYAEGSPHALLPFRIPHWHVVGRQDPLVPMAHVRDFVEEARSKGDQVEYQVVEDAGHFEVVIPGSTAWPTVERAILKSMQMTIQMT
jgi:acetyl esterase/lipase